MGRISWPVQELDFPCTECDSSYKTLKGLKEHRRDKHCPVLNKRGRSKSRRRQDLPFPCPDCGEFSYPTAKGLHTHRVQYCRDSQRWSGRRGRQGRPSSTMETGQEGNVAGSSSASQHQAVTASGEGNMDVSNEVGNDQTSQELEATAMDASLVSVTVSPSVETPNVEAMVKAAPVLEVMLEASNVEARVEAPRVVVKVCCVPGLGQREVRVGYRLAHTAPMQKVIEKVGLTTPWQPMSFYILFYETYGQSSLPCLFKLPLGRIIDLIRWPYACTKKLAKYA